MKTVATLVCAAAVLSLCASAWPAVLNVPGQYSTIQAAIDACAVGDTVTVAPGTYNGSGNRDLDFNGKDICVMSSNGPWVTIIDCQGSNMDPHRGFVFQNGETPAATVLGFTIQNGWAWDGGSIYCLSSSPTITGNVIHANTANYHGGGVSCQDASYPVITNNFVLGNQAYHGNGGGIFCYLDCVPTISGNLIEGNVAQGPGGGIYLQSSSGGTISANTIRWNTTNNWGGGIACGQVSPTIFNNRIDGNTATCGGGGGIGCLQASPIIKLNTIVGNAIAGWPGGGVDCWDQSSPTLDMNTITGNTASSGGAISSNWNCHPVVTNCILWGNFGAPPEISVGPYPNSSITVTYSDVQGGWAGTGNINAAPLFAAPALQECRLLWGSPCIDAGDPAGSPDPDGTRCDMGAHFFDQTRQLTLYLTPHAGHVAPGGQLSVTYTVINRQAIFLPFTVSSDVVLPNGNTVNVMGPSTRTIPATFTVQRLLTHNVPAAAPVGNYLYRSQVDVPGNPHPDDQDQFTFLIP